MICLYSQEGLLSPELRRRLEIIDTLTYECSASSVYVLLNISRQRLCTEPKDHFYGMLSICGPKLADKIERDCDQSVIQHVVFKDVFFKVLGQGQTP